VCTAGLSEIINHKPFFSKTKKKRPETNQNGF
jgi:hypothetical protein